MSTLTIDQSPNCEVVAENFGRPLDVELMQEFPEVSHDIVNQELYAINVPRDPNIQDLPAEVAVQVEIGRKSEVIKHNLGCTACVISGMCSVEKLLNSNIANANYLKSINSSVSMLTSAPLWLKVYRGAKTGTDLTTPDGEMQITSKLLAPDIDQEPTKNEIHEMLGGVLSEKLQDKPILELGELGIASNRLKQKGERGVKIPGVRISFEDTSRSYDIYDATEAVDFKGESIPKDEFTVIIQKFIDRVRETGPDGQAQISKADGTMQKPLHDPSTGKQIPKLFEIRMNGKNRLYITYEPLNDKANTVGGSSGRIVILGAHGGNVSTQNEFLSHIA